MLRKLSKKAVISLSIAAIMLLGGLTAYAATSGTAVLNSLPVGFNWFNAKNSAFEIVEGFDPQSLEGVANAAALTPISDELLASNTELVTFGIVEGFDPQILDEIVTVSELASIPDQFTVSNAEIGTFEIVEGFDPQILEGATAAAAIAPIPDEILASNAEIGTFEIVEGFDLKDISIIAGK